MGAPALLIGWFLAFFVFCLGLTVADVAAGKGWGLFGWGFLALSLIHGFPAAATVGLPLGVLGASRLRRIRDQRLHVLIFALAVGLVMAVVLGFLYRPGSDVGILFRLVLWTAASAAVGRASMVELDAPIFVNCYFWGCWSSQLRESLVSSWSRDLPSSMREMLDGQTLNCWAAVVRVM